MDPEQRKQRRNLRLLFFVAFPAMMFIMISFGEGVITAIKSTMALYIPLLIVYLIFAWRMHCFECRNPFSLDLVDQGSFHRTYECRYCGHIVNRWGGAKGSGGGGPG